MRRTLALAGIAVLGVTGLAGPASADPGAGAGVTTIEGVVINEVSASMGPSLDHNFSGGTIELVNPTDQPVDISGWRLDACNTTTTFDLLIELNVVLQPDEMYLIADLDYNAPTGPSPNQQFGANEILEQGGGGVELFDNDATPFLQDELRWGNPEATCDALADVGVAPTDDDSINRGNPWSHQIPSPERWN